MRLMSRRRRSSSRQQTSVDNSELLQAIPPGFTKTTNISVKVLAQGTGQALDTARRGDADLVLVHDPEAEQKFIDDGNGINQRQIAWNDFIILGPKDDLAHIADGHDALAALRAIASAKAAFVSRGDRSGTNALELRLWKAAVSTQRPRAAALGIETSAAAWDKRPTPPPRCLPTRSLIVGRG
jgi:tungstate transport system substrate-binding protein